MRLDELYDQLSRTISALDFERIWPGFAPLKFALYDNKHCVLDGSYIEKTDAFCANTSIVYQGEQIAIWNVAEEIKPAILASKIVHEMFHGFQNRQGWDCWADEMEALYHYAYSAGNLSLKLRENELLLSLLDGFDSASFLELLSLRRLRGERNPYEFAYESKVEEIEGSATFVEWMVLKQLDEQAAHAMEARMRSLLTKPDYLFPIRISSYYTGALLIHAMIGAGVYSYNSAERPVIRTIMRGIRPSDGGFPGKDACYQRARDAIASFSKASEAIITSALEKNEVVVQGPVEVVCVNIYDARCYKGYMTSRYFLQYRDSGGQKTIYGNFVLKMADEKTIACVYRWDVPDD